MSPKLCNYYKYILAGSEIPIQLRIRNKSIQTEETCHDMLKKDTTLKRNKSR